MEKLKGTSMNIVQDNIEKLKQIFPDIFSEEKIDFEALKTVLGEYVDVEQERYSFNWHGKNKAKRVAQEPSTGTLLPSKEDSKNWDSTDNLYIEGDNLEVLKLLQKSYHNKVKMIYIDPPYNTGKDFIYKDNFKDNLKNYLEITGQVGEEGQKLSTNSDSSGRYHSDWLNMMYPRLKLARNLLTDDGVILVHIDENEFSNLEKLLFEIMGEENNLGNIIWDKRNPKGDSKGIASQHESILVFAKNRNILLEKYEIKRIKKNANKILKKSIELYKNFKLEKFSFEEMNKEFLKWINSQTNFSGGEKAYNKIDQNGDVYRPVSMSWPNKEKAPDDYFVPLIHPITLKKCLIPERGWRNPSNTMQELISKNLILFGKDENSIPNRKYLLKENVYEKVSSVIYNGGSDTALLKELGIIFDTPKITEMTKDLLASFLFDNDIILDFFSGSATTAHAVMQLNAEDGGNRKYICVQLPEATSENSEAFKAGYKNICEIGKERIRRAGEKIKSDESLPAENREKLDVGFKVFKLSTSNIKEWDSETTDLKESLFDSIDNIKSDRTSLDVLYEILLKYGLDLNVPIVENKDFYSIGGGTLLVNLNKEIITLDVIDSICEEYKNLLEADEEFKTVVVLRDNSFKNDVDKTNAIQKLKQVGIKEIRSI